MTDNDTEGVDGESSGRADQPKMCVNCGKQIETTEWHPLVTRTDDDGNFHVYAFCDEACREEWAND